MEVCTLCGNAGDTVEFWETHHCSMVYASCRASFGVSAPLGEDWSDTYNRIWDEAVRRVTWVEQGEDAVVPLVWEADWVFWARGRLIVCFNPTSYYVQVYVRA